MILSTFNIYIYNIYNMYTSSLTYWLKYYAITFQSWKYIWIFCGFHTYLFVCSKKKNIFDITAFPRSSLHIIITGSLLYYDVNKWKLNENCFRSARVVVPSIGLMKKGGGHALVNHSAYNILIYTLCPLRIFISISYYYRIWMVRRRVIPTWNANWHSSSRGNRTRDRLLLFKNAYCVYIITPLFPLACNYTARRYSRLLHKGCTKYIILYRVIIGIKDNFLPVSAFER